MPSAVRPTEEKPQPSNLLNDEEVAGGQMDNDEDEEIPLEIEDFDCETHHEEISAEIEAFLGRILMAHRGGGGPPLPNSSSPHLPSSSLASPSRVQNAQFRVPGTKTEIEVTLHRDDLTHPISEWFGLSVFAVVRCKGDASPNLSSSCQRLSYLISAAANLELSIPCFTPTGDAFKGSYMGYCCHGPRVSRYTLEVYVPGSVPAHFRFTDGLVELMQLNVGLQSKIHRDPTSGIGISLDAHRTYRLVPHVGSDHDAWHDEVDTGNRQCIGAAGAFSYPFGPQQCPIDSINILCRWRGLDEGSVVDNATRSDLDILAPPTAVARPTRTGAEEPVTRRCQALLSVNLHPVGPVPPTHAADRLSTVAYPFIRHLQDLAGAHSLEVNDDPRDPTPMGGAERSSRAEIRASVDRALDVSAIPPAAVTNKCIRELWLSPQEQQHQVRNNFASSVAADAADLAKGLNSDIRFRFVPNNIFARFAHAASKLEHSDNVMAAWLEMVERLQGKFSEALGCHDLRRRGALLEDLGAVLGMCTMRHAGSSDGQLPLPDLDVPVVLQKLQMLQYVLQRIEHEATSSPVLASNSQRLAVSSPNPQQWGSDDELSFYSVEGDEEDGDTTACREEGNAKSKVPGERDAPTVGGKADAQKGRRATSNDGSLRGDVGDDDDVPFEPLTEDESRVPGPSAPTTGMIRIGGGHVAIPLLAPPEDPTSRPVPMTLDELEVEQNTLLKLGTGKQAQQTRMWMQSQTLRDDMSRFKSANPPVPHPRDPSSLVSPTFVDFVRWHSPKDYLGPQFDPKMTPSLTPQERLEALSRASAMPLEEVLTQRMHATGNVWLAMWESAPPVAPHTVFHPESVLDKIFQWLLTEASQEEVHLLVIIFNVSNVAHRIACHPAVMAASTNVDDDHYAVLKGILRDSLAEVGIVSLACVSAAAGLGFSTLSDVEIVRGKCSQMLRGIRDLELCMGLVVACTAALRLPQQARTDEDATAQLSALAARLACAAFMENRRGTTQSAQPNATVLVPTGLFWQHVLHLLPKDTQPSSRRTVLRCIAERPIHSEPTPQRLLLDVDASGLHRVAFSLSEEIP